MIDERNKRQNKQDDFSNMTLSGIIGKNPISSLLRMATTMPKKGAVPLYKQQQWPAPNKKIR